MEEGLVEVRLVTGDAFRKIGHVGESAVHFHPALMP